MRFPLSKRQVNHRGGQMRVVDRIIKPLKLSFIAGRPPLLKAAQQELQMAAEEQEKSF